VAYLLAGANWQRSGGKGKKPRPIQPPDGRRRKSRAERGEEAVRRLRNLGLIPGHGRQPAKPAPAAGPSPADLRKREEDAWLERQNRLAAET
jgi:hypothetical protein